MTQFLKLQTTIHLLQIYLHPYISSDMLVPLYVVRIFRSRNSLKDNAFLNTLSPNVSIIPQILSLQILILCVFSWKYCPAKVEDKEHERQGITVLGLAHWFRKCGLDVDVNAQSISFTQSFWLTTAAL